MGTILVATDGSWPAAVAVREAIALAAATGDDLVALTVLKPGFPARGEIVRGGSPSAPRPGSPAAHRKGERIVAGVLDAAAAVGVAGQGIVVTGYAPEQICVLAEEWDARLIVIGTHGRGPVRRFAFGSVATAVLHHARRPVLVVPVSAVGKRASAVVTHATAEAATPSSR
jgi:nucleotide-binding universal stress UspA family protein